MASKLRWRRKRYTLKQPVRYIWSLPSENGALNHYNGAQASILLFRHSHKDTIYSSQKQVPPSAGLDERSISAIRCFKNHFVGSPSLGCRFGRDDHHFSGLKLFMQSTHHLSTATAGQPQLDSGDDKKKADKPVKEPSPEDCDEAVEDLSSVKAKAKAKQLQDSQSGFKKIATRFWSMLLGIGPALKAIASMNRKDWAIKLHHWKDEFKITIQHYWLGTKLLWADVRISSRLLFKLLSGKGLSRREKQQLTRTTADIFRLVPVAVFIIVPFMEFLLPVFLKLFPNMLPSTFQDKMKEQEELKRRLNARIELAKFLQSTVKEMAKEVQSSRSGEIRKTAEALDEFMNKVRKGAKVSNEEILGFAKLFNDELTLDNISRPRLVNMCKYMNQSIWYRRLFALHASEKTTVLWHFTFTRPKVLLKINRQHLRCESLSFGPVLECDIHVPCDRIKNDDKMIQAEGVDSLSEAELCQACRDRGLLGLRSVEEMRQQLRDWLDLSLNHSVPSSLLILSRAFSVSGKVRPEEAVQATLSSLPDEVLDTVGVTSLPSEDSVAERKRKLEFLEMQEELIKEEEEEEEEEQAKLKESVSSRKDVALEEMIIPTAREVQEQETTRTLDQEEQRCELSRSLALLASASPVSREREEFLRLVKKEIELYNNMVEKEGTEGEEEVKKAYRASREDSDHGSEKADGGKVSAALINKVDAMLQKLEKEIDDVDAKIGDRWRLLDRDHDGKVTPEEVAAAAMYLKDTLRKDGVQELISNLSKDKDGKILVQDLVKLGSQTDDAEADVDETETESNEAKK